MTTALLCSRDDQTAADRVFDLMRLLASTTGQVWFRGRDLYLALGGGPYVSSAVYCALASLLRAKRIARRRRGARAYVYRIQETQP